MGEKTRLQMLLRPRPRHQTNRRRPLRQTALVLGIVLVFYYFIYTWHTPASSSSTTSSFSTQTTTPLRKPPKPKPNWLPTPGLKGTTPSTTKGVPKKNGKRPALTEEILNNLSLDTGECEAYFPGLTKEIDDVVAEGPFQVRQTGDLGPLQGRIEDGKVCFPFFRLFYFFLVFGFGLGVEVVVVGLCASDCAMDYVG